MNVLGCVSQLSQYRNDTSIQGPPAITFAPPRSACSIADGLSAPGCIQMFLMPRFTASATTCSVTFGGVMIDRPSIVPGTDAKSGYALSPSISSAFVEPVLLIGAQHLVAIFLPIRRRPNHGESLAGEKLRDLVLFGHWTLKSFGWILQTVLRPVGVQGFVVLPKRWIVERTFAWLARYRRHSKDYEKTTASREALTRLAMISLMTKRLENYET